MVHLSGHEGFLEFASKRMIRYPQSEKFMDWVCRYLLRHLKPMQVSIALYDPATRCYSIQVSHGRQRIPPRLISLPLDNPVIQWFSHTSCHTGPISQRSHRMLHSRLLCRSLQPEAKDMLLELIRHHVEVCVKIETRDRLAGYLFVGPRAAGEPYSSEDKTFFQILANDIAIEIEKEEYYQNSYYDHLTGLLNRFSLDTRAQELMDRTRDQNLGFGLALLDIDDFKMINDTYGHLVGDRVLRITGEMISSSVRKTDMAFRYGGEEFLILLRMSSRDPGIKRIDDHIFREGIRKVMDRLRTKIASRTIHFMGHGLSVTISIGLTFFEASMPKTMSELIQEADECLYQAKRSGKNRVVLRIQESRA